jgi:DNA ligase (NAD+)
MKKVPEIIQLLGLKTEADYNLFFETANQKYYDEGDGSFEINGISILDEVYDTVKDYFLENFKSDKVESDVGFKPKTSSGFKKVKHKIVMGSLLKLTDFEDFKSWWKKYTNGVCFWSEKIDGLSVSLEYEGGKFIQAISRGDSIMGEDITSNLLKSDIPKIIKDKVKITVRGEIFIKRSVFAKHFKEAINPRNAAVGLVKRLDSKETFYLSVLVYDVYSDEKSFRSLDEKIKYLKKICFSCPKSGIVNSPEELILIWEKYEKADRESADYEMDGLVITANDLSTHSKFGYVNNRPKYARALKFTSQTAITTLLSVDWQVGRTGRITPVALVKPVLIAGAMISKISIHNLAEINRLQIKLNQQIRVRRSGDVIPQIMEVINPKVGVEIVPPKKCPSCNMTNQIEDIFVICSNKKCPAQNYETLLHWVTVLDIKGFGDELVQQLVNAGKVNEPADFYKLTIEDISSLDRRGEKSAVKVLDALNSKKQITLPTFIKGLGIAGVGASITELAMSKFKTLNDLKKVKKVEELTSINGIGEISGQSLIDGLNENKDIIKNLLKYLSIIEEVENKTGKLFEKTFCFTGFRNKDIEKKIVSLGGKIVGGVVKDLSYLVTVDKDGSSSKIVKAKKLGIPVIEVDELNKLLG